LSDEEFWGLTVKKFNALMKCYSLDNKRQDFHAGLICAVLANIHRSKDSKVFKPEDFMPAEEQTPDQMLEKIKMYQNYFEVIDG